MHLWCWNRGTTHLRFHMGNPHYLTVHSCWHQLQDLELKRNMHCLNERHKQAVKCQTAGHAEQADLLLQQKALAFHCMLAKEEQN